MSLKPHRVVGFRYLRTSGGHLHYLSLKAQNSVPEDGAQVFAFKNRAEVIVLSYFTAGRGKASAYLLQSTVAGVLNTGDPIKIPSSS